MLYSALSQSNTIYWNTADMMTWICFSCSCLYIITVIKVSVPVTGRLLHLQYISVTSCPISSILPSSIHSYHNQPDSLPSSPTPYISFARQPPHLQRPRYPLRTRHLPILHNPHTILIPSPSHQPLTSQTLHRQNRLRRPHIHRPVIGTQHIRRRSRHGRRVVSLKLT